MSDAPRPTTKPAPGTTPDTELNVLAAIYRHAVERYEEAKAAEGSGGEKGSGERWVSSRRDEES